MALSDVRKRALAANLMEAAFVFSTNRYIPGGMTMDQAAASITAGLAEIAADSVDVPQGLDLRAVLLCIIALGSLDASQMGGHALEAAAWAVSAAALL
jgi:hypothetical protein